MTPRDPDGIVRSYLADGPAELSPRLAQAIRDDVQRTNQRAPRRSWRTPSMPRILYVLAPLAAVLLIAGALALGGAGNQSPPTATPLPSPAASAAAVAPSPAAASPDASSFPLADGEAWILYEGPDGAASLIRPDGTGAHGLLDAEGTRQNMPDWSPDGTQVVFDRDTGSHSSLWVVNADGTGGHAVTPEQEQTCSPCFYMQWPRWSPDGRSIAFVRAEIDTGRDISHALQVVDVASGTIRTVYESTTDRLTVPSWSPDGGRIVLAVETYESLATSNADGILPTAVGLGIVDLAADDPKPVPIPGLPAYPGHPDWSPDGTTIVFRTNPYVNEKLADPGAGSAIFTVAPDGSGLDELFRVHGDSPFLAATAWTPDGRNILHVIRVSLDDDPTLMIFDPATGTDASATGSVMTTGGEPLLRPSP